MKFLCKALLLSVLFVCSLGAIEVRNRMFTAELDPKGAVLTRLEVKGKPWVAVLQGAGSFDEQIGQNQGANMQTIEYTNRLDFALESFVTGKTETKIVFTLRSLAYPGLRLRKIYCFSAEKSEFTLKWELCNTGTQPLSLSLCSRAYLLRSGMVNSYIQPRTKGTKEFRDSEKVVFSRLPWKPFLALRNEFDDGLVLRLPAADTAGVMNWILHGPDGGYTLEFLSSEAVIPPGKTRKLEIGAVFTSNVGKVVEALPPRTPELNGVLPVQVERLEGSKPKARIRGLKNVPPQAPKFADVTFNRQFDDSFRTVKLPDEFKSVPVAVYRLENGAASPDRPVAFFREGGNIVLKVPGLRPGGNMLQHHERAWMNVEQGFLTEKQAPWRSYGPIAFPCRIVFGEKGGLEIPAHARGLMLNGGFEEPDGANKNIPAGCAFAANKWYKVAWLKSDPGTKGRCLDTGKCVFWDYLPEHDREFRVSFRLKSLKGGDVSRCTLFFVDAKGKILFDLRKHFMLSKAAFDWQKFDVKFRMPPGAAMVRLLFRAGGKREQKLLLDDLSIDSEAVGTRQSSKLELARKELAEVWNMPLSLLEPISMENVTPHEKWFKPAAEAPEVLFLTDVRDRIAQTYGRRKIVELAQRNDIKFTHVPLIRKIVSSTGAYSVYKTTFVDRLSDYTLEVLKNTKPPKVVCVMEVDFRRMGKEFPAILKEWQKQGCNFLFFRCGSVPKELTGKFCREPDFRPLMPRMRKVPSSTDFPVTWTRQGKSLVAQRGFVSRLTSFITEEQFKTGTFRIAEGRDFPWFEFGHQADFHILRHLSGIGKAVRLAGWDGKALKIRCGAEFVGTLDLRCRTLQRDTLAEKALPVKLKKGDNLVAVPDMDLPGGTFVLEVRLKDARGRVADCGAAKLDVPETIKGKIEFADRERIFRYPAPVKFKVTGIPADWELAVEIENNRGEVVFREKRTGKETHEFTVTLPGNRTLLNYVRAEVKRQGRRVGRLWGEFSVAGLPLPLDDYYGFINKGFAGTEAIHDLGFDFVITTASWGSSQRMRVLRCGNYTPIPRRGDDAQLFRAYRSDVKSAPVRKPCFSSPEMQKKFHDDIVHLVNQSGMRYYDVQKLWAGDEMYLGQSVCTSPSCLAAFRAELKKIYGSVEKLNAQWGSSFRSFDEAVPCQKEELKDRNNLSPWLDHKMFMTHVFARYFFGKLRDELALLVPGAATGPTGTAQPGYGCNWWEMLKYCRMAGYYSGVQTTMVNDFGKGQLLAGQCGGGYTHGHIDYEPYNYDTMWLTLINGGNLAYHYVGCAISGDWKITDNMKYFSNSMKELKRGIGKMWLSAAVRPEVAVLYSQNSLFTAMATLGEQTWQDAQTSWVKLLGDLRMEARFISYEELAKEGVPGNFKAVVLPMALSISEAEAEQLVRFAERGGLVIADMAPGRYDGHGRRRTQASALDKLFAPQTGEIKPRFTDLPELGGRFEVGEPGTPLMQFRKCGKGGGLNVNLLVNRYSMVKGDGTGGEVATSSSGEKPLLELWRKLVGKELRKVGIAPYAQVTAADGTAYPCVSRFRQEKGSRFYAFHLPAGRWGKGRFAQLKGEKVRVKLPAPGHVYEVRGGRYLGFTAEFEMKMIPGWSLIYAVLDRKAGAVTLDCAGTFVRGGKVNLAFGVADAAGPQVFRLALFGPGGKELEHCARNIRTPAGKGGYGLFIPFNAAPGKYEVRLTHVASGQRTSRTFAL